jgi:glycine cleavage system H protein
MGTVRGCNIPEDLYYNVENNVWARKEDDGNVTIGMTAFAASLAGDLVAFTPKKEGKSIKKDKSAATVESGKWVGPVKSPVAGDVVETNAQVADNPALVNQDPYSDGWLVKLAPADWDGDSGDLVTGQEALDAFEKKMDADGFDGC